MFALRVTTSLLVVLTTLAACVLADGCTEAPPPTMAQLRAGAVIPRDLSAKPARLFRRFTNGRQSLAGFPSITVTVTVDDPSYVSFGGHRQYVAGVAAIGSNVQKAAYHVVLSHGHGDGAKIVKTFAINGFQDCWASAKIQRGKALDSIDHVTLVKVP